MPSFVEPHAHLDKALTASRAPNRTGDLLGAIAAMQAIADTLTHEDIVARAEAAIRTQLALGTTSIRTHVNVGGPMGMRALAALIEVRERWRGLADVQLVALVANPLAGQAGRDLRQALREGADVAGGCPHLDPEPDRAVGICLDAAGEAGVPMDLHTDETLNPRLLTLETMADLVLNNRFPAPGDRQPLREPRGPGRENPAAGGRECGRGADRRRRAAADQPVPAGPRPPGGHAARADRRAPAARSWRDRRGGR